MCVDVIMDIYACLCEGWREIEVEGPLQLLFKGRALNPEFIAPTRLSN